MRLTLHIDMDNAAFFNDDKGNEPDGANGAEAARILRRLASRICDDSLKGGDGGALLDSNGNSCGHWEVKD